MEGLAGKLAFDYPLVMTGELMLAELRRSSTLGNHTSDVILEKQTLSLKPGEQEVTIAFSSTVAQAQYVFICFMRNEQVQIQGSERRITGILSVFNKFNKAVSNHGKQDPEQDIGMEAFEFWCPARRPGGHNLAMRLRPGLFVFGAENLRSGVMRPTQCSTTSCKTIRTESSTSNTITTKVRMKSPGIPRW